MNEYKISIFTFFKGKVLKTKHYKNKVISQKNTRNSCLVCRREFCDERDTNKIIWNKALYFVLLKDICR